MPIIILTFHNNCPHSKAINCSMTSCFPQFGLRHSNVIERWIVLVLQIVNSLSAFRGTESSFIQRTLSKGIKKGLCVCVWWGNLISISKVLLFCSDSQTIFQLKGTYALHQYWSFHIQPISVLQPIFISSVKQTTLAERVQHYALIGCPGRES